MSDHFIFQQRRQWSPPARQPSAHRWLAQAAIALLLCVGSAFALARSAYAATINVDGTNCTLDEAITAANNDDAAGNGCTDGSGADTIVINSDVTLAARLPAIASDLTIQGDVAGRIVSGGGVVRVFTVNSGTVTFQNLHITDGKDLGSDGSDGYSGGGGGLGAGGGLYIDNGTVLVQNVTFDGNEAAGGIGGIDILDSNDPNYYTGGQGGGSTSDPDAGGDEAQNGDFGGGGGGAGVSSTTVGDGGFGGGGGGGGESESAFGGGVGTINSYAGAAGAGLGGAIFVRAGVLTLKNNTFSNNSATAGTSSRDNLGVPAGNGQGLGGAIFICTSQEDGSCSATVLGVDNTIENNNTASTDFATVYGTITPAAAEIAVQGNGAGIANGDDTPSTTDDTDFGTMTVNSGNVVRTFTISNTGNIALTLSGSPLVSVNGNSAFSVSTQPASSVAAGGNTTFQLTLAPTISGTITATVRIASNDSDENPYTFVVQAAVIDQIDRGGQVTQPSYTALYQATPQACANEAAPGLPIHTLTPTLLNNTSNSYRSLYFVVTELGYSVAQGSNVPTLCNADGGNGGRVGVRVTVADATLGDGRFAPAESFAQAFQVGLPVRARYRLFVNLYALPTTVTAADSAAADLLGVLSWEFDENGNLVTSRQVFLPLVTR